MNPVLITGAAGFIGMHCAKRLLAQGVPVVGIDNLNNYYDVALKHARLAELRPHAHFRFVELDVADRQGMADLFADWLWEIDTNLHITFSSARKRPAANAAKGSRSAPGTCTSSTDR